VTLVAVNAVVHIPVHILVVKVTRIVAAVAARALEHGVVARICVARGANTVCVSMGDREWCVLRVIECRPSPGGGVVAVLAGSREELRLRGMAGVGGVVVVGLMATDTRGWQRRVVIVDMAVGAHARRHQVRTGKGEGCVAVIERRVCPDDGVVAEFARSRESGRTVRRIVRASVVVLMARIAEGAVQRIIVVDMAVRALPRWNGVTPR